jgi:molybdopterin molybdotransferase
MSLFLSTIPVDEAISTGTGLVRPVGTEMVPLEECPGRVLAEDISSDVDIPGFSRSVVDGYALRASDTTGAGESSPAMLNYSGSVKMGSDDTITVRPGECVYIPTGGKLPSAADAVAMIEYSEPIGDQVLVKKTVAPGENIIFRGEDFSAGRLVVRKGRRLSPQDTGVLAAVGRSQVPVFRSPVVGVISTGNELVPVDTVPSGGQVRDVNSFMCGAFLAQKGFIPRYYGITRDERDSLRTVFSKAVSECDAVLISGGSSKDDRDMSADIIREAGEVRVHGIAIAPGKPTILGRAGEKPVIGLPGHPASAYIVLMVIGQPMLSVLAGESSYPRYTTRAVLGENIPSTRGREDYVRVVMKDRTAWPLFGKSGLLNTLVESHGVVRIPAGSEGLEASEEVDVILW